MDNKALYYCIIGVTLPYYMVGYWLSANATPLGVTELNVNSNVNDNLVNDNLINTDNSNLDLQLTLVGIFVNGREQMSPNVLVDVDGVVSIDAQSVESDNRLDDSEDDADNIADNANKALTQFNDYYYLPIEALAQLTAVEFVTPTSSTTSPQVAYQVITPIGDTQLSHQQITSYQGDEYLSLSALKPFGISAHYSQPDLAIKLNMGWRPENQRTREHNANVQADLPIDYYPDKAGIVGLSFRTSMNVSESNHQNGTPVRRSNTASLGVLGHAMGGIWGIKGSGSDNNSDDSFNDSNNQNQNSFAETSVDGLSQLPWDWKQWQIDNLYWAKSGENFATRLGTNQPNGLGQGAKVSGSTFTGAMVAYSNRSIDRHLTNFDQNSASLLQNTNQDYQNIRGMGEPGGVAELRVNGRRVARVQIGLDGRYEFLNLDVNQLDLANTLVEIAIFAYPLAREPLEVRTITLGKRRSSVATDELLVEAGIGRSGNLFDDTVSYEDSASVAHVYAEYGLNNQVAIRGGAIYDGSNNDSRRRSLNDNDSDIAWYGGVNLSPNVRNNMDLSYAHSSTQDIWQANWQYLREKLTANYHYQNRQYEAPSFSRSQNLNGNEQFDERLNDQRHQLLLSYRLNEDTSLNFNQYYNDLENSTSGAKPYYNFTSINHRFSDSFDAGISYNSRDNNFNYRLLFKDICRDCINSQLRSGQNTLGLSGDNNSDTLTLSHKLSDNASLSQSVSRVHGNETPLYQGDITYDFDNNEIGDASVSVGSGSGVNARGRRKTWNLFDNFDNSLSIGYSLYDNNLGWQADWQAMHDNGLNFSLGYKNRYISAIPDYKNESGRRDNEDDLWSQNSFFYVQLSFDMFKTPQQPLRFGNLPYQRAGSVIVDISHPEQPAIDTQSIQFKLDDNKVTASLLNAQSTSSQYMLSGIKAGDYTLNMDAKDLPLEYSTAELETPRIRVNNYAPTSVPIALQTTYGISGKVTDGKQGVMIDIYTIDDSTSQSDSPLHSIKTSSYGYFQLLGLPPNTYVLQAEGYEPTVVDIANDFLLQIKLEPIALDRP